MTFVPVIPIGGYAGYRFLERTSEAQREAHGADPVLQRDLAYFRENIGEIETAKDLVDDYRLRKIALGAFGLDDDINSKFFIQKVLEEGTLDQDALANKLTDKRYAELAEAFAFDLGTPNTKLSTFAGEIEEKYLALNFEGAVGAVSEPMRLALNAKRELSELAQETSSDNTKWFTILGTPPLRAVFEQALNLPSSFGALDLDRQLDVMKDRTESLFGSDEIGQFEEAGKLDDLVERYLVMGTLTASTPQLNSANTALILLGAG